MARYLLLNELCFSEGLFVSIKGIKDNIRLWLKEDPFDSKERNFTRVLTLDAL
jgi:hypothetical protein